MKKRSMVRFGTICSNDVESGRKADFIFDVFYIQVDLGEMFVLTAVATQGRPNKTWPQYISEYYVGYSSDGEIFTQLTDEKGDVKVSTYSASNMSGAA